MKTLLVLLLALLLIGCATAPKGCAPVQVPVQVKVPVAVPCKVKPVDKPALPIDAADPASSVAIKVRAALDSLDLLKGYTSQLEAAVAACQ